MARRTPVPGAGGEVTFDAARVRRALLVGRPDGACNASRVSCRGRDRDAEPALDLTAKVDELTPYRKLRGRLAALDPGGGVNVAHVVRRCDIPVVAVAPLRRISGPSAPGRSGG
jgi:hypothetical protein